MAILESGRENCIEARMSFVDYYEMLQISPNAQMDTIHRVYRMLAQRFHPDNPESADTERFLKLQSAYAVLSNPERKTEYDGTAAATTSIPWKSSA